jgi:hypothetical protein
VVDRLGSGAGARARQALLEAWAAHLDAREGEGDPVASPLPSAPLVPAEGPTDAPPDPEGAAGPRRTRAEDAFVSEETFELQADAARHVRGRLERASPPPPDAVRGDELRAAQARAFARKVSPKTGAGTGARAGRDSGRPTLHALPHPGSFVTPSPSARLLGSQQPTPHRPAGASAVVVR